MGRASFVLMDVVMGSLGLFLLLSFFAREDAGRASAEAATRASGEITMASTVSETPDEASDEANSYRQPVLTIVGTGHLVQALYLNEEEISANDLAGRVKSQSIRKLRIRAHPDLAVQKEREIKWQCRQAGVDAFEDVHFKTAP